MKPAARRKARILALQAIYSWQVSGNNISNIEQQMLLEMQSSASQSLAESARNIEVGGVVDPSSQRSPKEVAPKSTKNKKSGPKLK